MILAGQHKPVIRVGNLSSRRAVMDVRDCVVAYYELMMKPSTGVFNVGGDNSFTMGDLLCKMLDMYGLSGKVAIETDQKLWRPIDIPIQMPDTDKVKKEISWDCKYTIDRTLADLVNYWRAKIA
ncbi:hypothetical protein DFAR_3900002 [Desulfarculales bacterium]